MRRSFPFGIANRGGWCELPQEQFVIVLRGCLNPKELRLKKGVFGPFEPGCNEEALVKSGEV